jgi:hypothetical protein
MNALPGHAPFLSPPPGRAAVSLEALAMCVRALDPGSRALLDLSLRRRLPFETMAGFLHTDPFDLARRRARAVARIAAELDLEGAGVVAAVKAALARLPDDAWCVPVVGRAAPCKKGDGPLSCTSPAEEVQAESMAEAARALMEKLREHREAVRHASIRAGVDLHDQPTIEMEVVRLEDAVAQEGDWSSTGSNAAGEVEPEVGTEARPTPKPKVTAKPKATARPEAAAEPERDPAVQPTVESQAIVPPPEPEPWRPVAATPMAAAFSHHPAFAIEVEDDAAGLPPLAAALADAATAERAAAEAREPLADPAPEPAREQPTVETEAIRTPAPAADRPAQPLTVTRTAEREPRRRLARGGLIIGLLLAVLRLLFGRR